MSTILVVEDEAIIAMELRVRLAEMGHRVVGVARTAEQAVSLAREHVPDLVLMDVRLARGGDGVAAAAEIRAGLDAAVVFVSAQLDEETLRRAQAIARAGYLAKPFDERSLRAVIDATLGG